MNRSGDHRSMRENNGAAASGEGRCFFPDEWESQVSEVSRSWVIYHVLEHDLRHGGELSLILGMHRLRAIER